MQGINLPPPVEVKSPLFSAWITDSLRRIVDGLNSLNEEFKTVVTVTGTLTVPTGLAKVKLVVASFYDNPIAGACFLAARPSPTQGSVLLNVYTSTFAASTTAINVSFVAFGL